MIKNLGEQIQKALELHNLTQKEAAKQLHISPQSLNSYIKNRRYPSFYVLCDLIHFLNLDVDILFNKAKYSTTHKIYNEEEQEILNIFRTLDTDYKNLLFLFLSLLKKCNKS